VKRRVFNYTLPFGIGHFYFPYSVSDLCGHGSFAFLALSYLENDFLNLRLYAAGGISLSIIFQYYRENPLWIPIRWNTLFLVINSLMILLLLKESNDAENIPDEQKALYDLVFNNKGMKPVDFLHLMSLAERKEYKKGEKVVTRGNRHHQLHLVKSGRLSVKRDGEELPTIGCNQFAGAMSYLTWENKYDVESRNKTMKKKSAVHMNDMYQAWHAHTYLFFGDEAGDQEVEIRANGVITAIAKNYKKEEIYDNQVKQMVDESESYEGMADVTCEEDCVLFSWNFKELRELLLLQPSVGIVFERCISADLNNKMLTMMDYEKPKKVVNYSSGSVRIKF
jgi:CRP-like cAMP-binding protein